jgi:transcriptional regulator with XRE-family HTH domain
MARSPAEDIGVRFGKRVRKLRQSRGWTILYFAVHSGLAKTFVQDVERARKEPCLHTIEVFAKSFDLTVSQLMRGL